MAKKMSLQEKKDLIALAWEEQGVVRLPRHDYGPRKGLEGPFQYRSGKVLYYDPREGKYYDPGSDLYVEDEDVWALTTGPYPRRSRTMPRRNSRHFKAESPRERYSIGISAANLSSFPRPVQNAYRAGVKAAKTYMPGRVSSVKVAKRSIFNSIRSAGDKRAQQRLNATDASGQAYRAGVRDTVKAKMSGGKAKMSGGEWPIEMRSDYVRRGGEWVRPNPRRRRRNESAETRRVRRMLTAIRGGDLSAAPERVADWTRSGKGKALALTWKVETGYNATYEYRVKKLGRDYVTEFRRIRPSKGSVTYISDSNTASANKTFYPTQKAATSAAVQHIISGKHVPFRNPRCV